MCPLTFKIAWDGKPQLDPKLQHSGSGAGPPMVGDTLTAELAAA